MTLLKQHVSEMMQNVNLTDREMLRVIIDKKLLSEVGNIEETRSVDTTRFLASYIVLSQILFLRLFSRTRPDIVTSDQSIVSWD